MFLLRWILAENEVKRLRGVLNYYNIKIEELDKKNNKLSRMVEKLR